MIQIRTAIFQDAELIADFSREAFYETYAAQNTKTDMDKFLSEQFSKAQLMAEVGNQGNHFILAHIDDKLVGYVFMKEGLHADLSTPNAIEIVRLYAHSSFIGKGVGKTLMQAAIAYAAKESKQTIWLGVWKQNQRALQFYHAFGFEKFSEQDFILGNDVQRDWLMQLLISNY
jgi:ribosomal protein S18 acetylase RimI-like enzyme